MSSPINSNQSQEDIFDNVKTGDMTDLSSTPPISDCGRKPSRARTMSCTSYGSYNRIVMVAVDPSPNARRAFDWYLENMHKSDDLIVLCHCPEAPHLPTFSFKSGLAPPVHEWKNILDDMNDRTKKLEEDYEGDCIIKKLKYKVRGESFRNVGEGIVKTAEEEKADVIILGTRGMGTIKRALLGSVSDYVIRNAGIPVVTVPIKRVGGSGASPGTSPPN